MVLIIHDYSRGYGNDFKGVLNMCRFISFFHKPDADGKPEIAVWDLNSHGETEEHLKLNTKLWQEAHYEPNGNLELRYNDNFKLDKKEYEEIFKNRFVNFSYFLNHCLKHWNNSGYLDLRGCDLKGITLPTTIGGYLDLRGCDLKGITLPTTIDGSLYLSGCDLKGITLPTTIGGFLYLSGCDLKGITLPTTIGGYLDLSGCDLKGLTIPKRFKNKIIK